MNYTVGDVKGNAAGDYIRQTPQRLARLKAHMGKLVQNAWYRSAGDKGHYWYVYLD